MSASQSDSEETNFDQSLEKLERSLFSLKDRYAQVQRDQQRKAALETQKESAKLKTELREIEQQLEELEINLESRLFSWSGLREIFWLAVRFGGLGIAIGWSLALVTLKDPAPTPSTPSSLSSPK
ncbi:MAG: hypothetical protein MUC48_20355 [Leptolyngbya sp. Prado105]|jgi:hypothetical protein|nr:hypothetical protein [Leptolyngbya sp. Prado105]